MHTDNRIREIAGVLVIMLAIIVFCSLFSYSIEDDGLLAHHKPVNNYIGMLGAFMGGALRTGLGYSAYLLVAALAIVTRGLFCSKPEGADSYQRIASLSFATIASASLIALALGKNIPQYAGGLAGRFVAEFLTAHAGTLGAAIILIALNIIALVLLGLVSVSLALSAIAKKNIGIAGLLSSAMVRLRQGRGGDDITSPGPVSGAIKRKNKKPPWIVKQRVPVTDKKSKLKKNDFQLLVPRQIGFDKTVVAAPSARGRSMMFENRLVDPDFTRPEIIFSPPLDDDRDMPPRKTTALSGEPVELFAEPVSLREVPLAADDELVFDGIQQNRIRSIERDALVNSAIRREEPAIEEAEADDIDDDDDVEITAETETYSRLDGDEPGGFDDGFVGAPATVFRNIDISSDYIIPTSYLKSSESIDYESFQNEVRKNSELLTKTMRDFGIEARVVKVNRGPVITLYEMQIAPGIKVNRIVALADDIAMALAASRVRVVAPIPGKSAIGVEVPNRIREIVTLGDILTSHEYNAEPGKLKVSLGKDILGKPVIIDLKKMPHLLIAGATGSGKSVCVNSIITSLVYNYEPNYLRFILVDPKMVELQLYNGLPHLLTPVITEPHVSPKALKWAMMEMERRYKLLSQVNTRDIDRYNEKVRDLRARDGFEHLPYIVIIMDELADLMMVAQKEIEGFITRIAQKARAVGIHLVLATQRPSVNVITGIIKANFPARIAFQVAQKTDSRTIIDQNGAEKLLGKGDMLYQSPMSSFPMRIQGAYIGEDEIMNIVNHLEKLGKPSFIDIQENLYDDDEGDDDETVEDDLFVEALKIVEDTKKASASYLQRRLSIGYNRSARIIELMEERGYIGPQQGSKPREVFI